MRLVMMGTGPFGVPTFRLLYETHHTLVALITNPLKDPATPPSTIRDVAAAHGTPILEPADVNSPPAQVELATLEADLLVVCDYGQILTSQTLATARLGGVNLHASLLPKYRGAAPINWAIYHGETETGVSVIHMTPQVDAGPIIAQGRTPIGPDETAVDVERRLGDIGAWFVRRSIDSLEEGRLEALPQNPAVASKAPRLKKTDGRIDWTRSAEQIRNQVRALEPWPKTYTFWERPAGQPLRLIPGPLSVVDGSQSALPGTVIESAGGRLVVAAGDRAVALTALQPSGKRMLPVSEFLRGYRVEPGQRFGDV